MANSYQRQISASSSRAIIGGQGYHLNLGPSDSNSTTRNYIIADGKIHFWKNFGYEPEGHPFVKAAHDTDGEAIAAIMHRQWRMQPPRIVALIISNVDSLRDWSNPRQIDNFKKGLIKAANTTNMWIFTTGTNLGASKIIGDAVSNEIKERQSFHCHPSHSKSEGRGITKPPNLNFIGITREDAIKYADQLGSDKTDINIENQGNIPEEGKYDLNPDHTHFIVVRDSTINKTGINLFVLRLMGFLSTVGGCDFIRENVETDLHTKIKDVPDLCSLTNMEIPVVSIVVQGGYDCARLVVDCLKRQYPVVVLKGSGGLADLLAFAYSELEQRARETGPWGTWDPEYVENFLKPELVTKIAHFFPKLRENVLTRNLFRDRILECVRLAKQNSLSFITVLNMHNYSECKLENLSVYLLRALFASKPRSSNRVHDYSRSTHEGSTVSDDKILKELYLTLDWNCPDVASSEVLHRDPTYVVRLQKDLFQSALLRPDREEFVDLFLSNGFRLHKFVTPTRLRRLFKHIYEEEFFHTVCWEGVLGHSLLSRPSKHFIDTDLNWLIETCTGFNNFVNSDHLYYNVMSMYVYNAASAERKALAILTLWAIFSSRHKLAKTLWKHSDQPIHLALVASMVYSRLSSYVGDTNVKTDLKNYSRIFAEMATGVLDDCYNDATCRAFDVLSEESPDWNYKTAVDIASNARTKIFLAHQCCQKWLTDTFLGDIRIRELGWGVFTLPESFKIIVCAFLILPMFIWVRFKPRSSRGVVEEQEDDEKDGQDNQGGDEVGGLMNSGAGGENLAQMAAKTAGKAVSGVINIRGADYVTLIRDREVFIRQQPPLLTMIKLMWSAPITKFHTFQVFYIAYLVLFSIAVLYPSCGNQTLDYTVCVWTSLIVMEHIRRTWILYKKYTSIPLVWKCIEIFLIIIFIIVYTTYTAGLNLKFLTLSPYGRKVVLSVALLYFYYRLIAMYLPISPTLGPLLYRLRLMIGVDFLNFMRMAIVIIVSGGVVMQALLFPDLDLTLDVVKQAFHRAWFSLFLTPVGDLSADSKCKAYPAHRNDPSTCYAGKYNNTANPTLCPDDDLWSYIFAIQYFVLLKLIMMTLLYALFSATASKLEGRTEQIWKYQRYILVVDFANRLPLPAPLSIFCYIYFVLKWIFRTLSCYYCFKWMKNREGKNQPDGAFGEADTKYNMKLSEEDYNFWRHLARQYANKAEKNQEEKDIIKKQWEGVQSLAEEIEYEKRLMKKINTRVSELERMMTLSHVYLENIKHISSLKFGNLDAYGSSPSTTKSFHHILSRQSPYPGTRVQRIPVPDKYVPWEVMWIDYDPVAYTKQKMDFPQNFQHNVDEDILFLREYNIEQVTSKLPVFNWNSSSTNPAGITIDRTSWITKDGCTNLVYSLDSGIPRNPFGRTGLKGKGSLPRWGPNHYVMFVITRWRTSRIVSTGKLFEFIVEKNLPRWDQISLPNRFVPGDNWYGDLQTLFNVPDDQQWTNDENVEAFFTNCSLSNTNKPAESEDTVLVKFIKNDATYMDDPLNTDMAWKELVLIHVHFTGNDDLDKKMTPSLNWRIITEDVFLKLPSGQSTILQSVTNKLQATII
ncbi:protein ced-11 isoform X2 [Tetranychus urticae]|uniref:Uncharacterized protein n=2 Tax=Tetranychus urticae TaxID=32264 RepID=T1K2M8_TETUR|nr:protein ced-11 isoform X2 [Tetranychus urticae]